VAVHELHNMLYEHTCIFGQKFDIAKFQQPLDSILQGEYFFLVSLAFGNSIVVHHVDYWYFKDLSHQNKLKHFQRISAYREHVIRSPLESRCSLCICIVIVCKTLYIYLFLCMNQVHYRNRVRIL